MSSLQVKSKQRARDHGEVYTHEREVNAMLDLVAEQAADSEATFLEPACGNGNFLAEILCRKLQTVAQKHKKIQHDYERTALIALGSLYGIDLLPDNVAECVARLYQIFVEHYQTAFPKSVKPAVLNAAHYILSQNILCGDALKLQTESGEPIVFAEWKAINGSKIKRRDYAFSHLLDDSKEEYQLSFFSDNGNQSFIPEPVKEYPAVNFWELGK